MKKNLIISLRFTLVTTVIFGLVYPLVITGFSELLFPAKAKGQLLERNGRMVGSRIIGQAFTGPRYFHSRPSAAGAGNGYDPRSSSGSNLGPTSKTLFDRVDGDVQKLHAENPASTIPIDLITTSASGLDPDISPAAAEFQISRVARERHIDVANIRPLVAKFTLGRQLGFLGESRVNVLELNLELDALYPFSK